MVRHGYRCFCTIAQRGNAGSTLYQHQQPTARQYGDRYCCQQRDWRSLDRHRQRPQFLPAEATQGNKLNSEKAYAYPNPVQPGYDGPIAIYGLARDANIKITDVSGQLVYEGKALGGQAVWNGRDYLGRRAASGVYLVFATSSESFESPDAIITKVVILN
jgi:hypothetical protein